jgi:hypothetical protein
MYAVYGNENPDLKSAKLHISTKEEIAGESLPDW